MVLFGLTAQILDTIVLKTASFTIDTTFSLISWSVKSIYGWYVPSRQTNIEKLEKEIKQLKNTISIMETNTINGNMEYILIETKYC